jgi:hypothetical protein
MAALTPDEIAAKIATAESDYAAATSQYDRNVFAQILDEYKHYATGHAKRIAKQAAAGAGSASAGVGNLRSASKETGREGHPR